MSGGSGGSTISASGSRIRPPAVSCQAVKLRAETGGCHFRLRTVPAAIDAAPPSPAVMPMGSSAASGPISRERHAQHAGRRRADRARPDRRSKPAARHEDHHHRLQRAERRGDPAGKPVGGHEQEHPEEREVQTAKQEDAAEPGAGRQATRDSKQQESGWQEPGARQGSRDSLRAALRS